MKSKKSRLFVVASAMSALALMVSGCFGGSGAEGSTGAGSSIPAIGDLWEFSKVVVGKDAVAVDDVNKIAHSGDSIVVVGKDKIFLSTDGGATFTASDSVTARRASNEHWPFILEAKKIDKVRAYKHGFVFSSSLSGIVVTNAAGEGLVAFSAQDANDGIPYGAIVTDVVVSGDILVVGKQYSETVIKLPKQAFSGAYPPENVKGALYDHQGKKIGTLNSNDEFGVGANGDVFVVMEQTAAVWHFTPANLMLADADPSKETGFAFGKNAWPSDGYYKKVKAVTATKDNIVLFLIDNSEYIYGKLSGGPVSVGKGKIVGFWIDDKKEVYGITKAGLRKFDSKSGKFEAKGIDVAYVKAHDKWVGKADPKKPYTLDSNLVLACFETANGNVIIETDKGLHVGVKTVSK